MGPGQIAPYLREVKKRNVIRIPGRITEAGRNTRSASAWQASAAPRWTGGYCARRYTPHRLRKRPASKGVFHSAGWHDILRQTILFARCGDSNGMNGMFFFRCICGFQCKLFLPGFRDCRGRDNLFSWGVSLCFLSLLDGLDGLSLSPYR